MEEKENAVTQTEEKNEVAVTQTEQNEKKEKTFTQAQLDEIIKDRLKNYPNKEELEKYNKWKESQKTESEKQAEKDAETQRELAEGKMARKELVVLKKGVAEKFSRFVASEVGELDGNFEENLTKYLKDNPQYLQINDETRVIKRTSTSASMNGKAQVGENETNKIMNDIIRSFKK